MRLLLTTAIIALSAGASFAQSLGGSDSSIRVQGGTLANQPVQFGNRGSITSNGFSTGSLSSSISNAEYNASGYAFMNPAAGTTPPNSVASSGSGSSVDTAFTRQIETSGSSIGLGTLTVQGAGTSKFSGDVNSSSSGNLRTITPNVGGGSTLTTSGASTGSQATLAGEGNTSAGLQLNGTSNNFVGTGSNEVAGTQRGVAIGANNTTGANGSSQSIDPFQRSDITANTLGNLDTARTAGNTGTAGLVFVFGDNNGAVNNAGATASGGTINGVNLTQPNLGGGNVINEVNTNGSTTGFFGANGTTNFGQIIQP